MENVSVLVAIGIGMDGHREAVGVAEGMREDAASWNGFIAGLISRGLTGVPNWSRRWANCCPKRVTSGVLSTSCVGVPARAGPRPVGRRRPEGRVRHGITRSSVGQGRAGRRRNGIQETQPSRQVPARGHRRDHHLPAGRVSGRAPPT